MQDYKLLSRLSVRLVQLSLKKRQWPDNSSFVQAVYWAYLKREPDEMGRAHFVRELERGGITRRQLLQSVMASSEFRLFHELDVHPLHALHQARMILVQTCLPPAQMVVDLGGAAVGRSEGALLLMGYPHRPREIAIVDLPPEQRINDGTGHETSRDLVTADGTHIRYYYHSMSDLAMIGDAQVDLCWSGESIEHVTEAEADQVCREAYRILKPGGYFCLDTPNAALTRLQSPHELIHPEHKIEYRVQELKAKLARWGFTVGTEKGVCPMPVSLRRGVFDYREMVSNIRLSENAEEGYFFYLQAIKPDFGTSGTT